ncbi:MAG TPA: FprA family A-type flavoprotein [Chromatiales bacterium]|nr:FprA family A-type flavoprotein [Chromatiales bacterium]
MSDVLFEEGDHKVYLFSDLVTGDGIQSNQLFIYHDHHSALFDPGGQLTFQPLQTAMAKICPVKELDYLIATHQDPDIITSLDRWLMYTEAKILISRLWERFLPHLVPGYMNGKGDDRIMGIPDQGANIKFGNSVIKALPAHFLHSVGNLHFYDPVSKILFSGDVGASLVDVDHGKAVEDFDAHVKSMQGFHERYMGSNRVCRLWVNMVRNLDVDMIVPQHGRPFVGDAMINRFLDWFSELECGIDLLDQNHYRIP